MNNYIPIFRSFNTPKNEKELMYRAHALVGYTLGELSTQIGFPIPINLKYNKGWIGFLLEYYLGAKSGNKTEQDFSAMGIELKTIPIDSYMRPLETTFICTASLTGNNHVTWETSYVRYKMSKVLWIPIEGQKSIPLIFRRICVPVLWKPNIEEEWQLRCDWEELMDLIVLGKIKEITARQGEVLQLRQKATSSKTLTTAIGEYGQTIFTRPRGFYLKKKFTSQLLARYFEL